MKKKQKGGTPDLRDKLVSEVVKKVMALLKAKGYEPDKTVVERTANDAIDDFIAQWYEVSLEAIELKDGEADFVTDDEIDDPELIKEAKRRVIKELYEEPPEDFFETIVQSAIVSH
jgi:phosphosulfolactate synthase (CoM biosynthesis protein A)